LKVGTTPTIKLPSTPRTRFKNYGAGVKCATITPDEARVEKFGLKKKEADAMIKDLPTEPYRCFDLLYVSPRAIRAGGELRRAQLPGKITGGLAVLIANRQIAVADSFPKVSCAWQ
jgi:hypothetical protein